MSDYISPSGPFPTSQFSTPVGSFPSLASVDQYAPPWDDPSTATYTDSGQYDLGAAVYDRAGSYTSHLPSSPPTPYHNPKPRYPAQALPYAGGPQDYTDGYYLQSSAMLPMMAPHGAPSKIDKSYTAPRHELYPVPRSLIHDYQDDYNTQPRAPYIDSSSRAIRPPSSPFTEFTPRISQMSHGGSPPQSAVDLHRVSPGLPFQEPSPPHSLSHHGVESSTSEKVPNLACFFCRSRKIACGRPMDGGACNQCTKRGNKCVYPIGSRRGQHKRGTPLPKKQNSVGHMGLNVGFGF